MGARSVNLKTDSSHIVQANLVSKEPVNSLTFSQAVAEHEQMLGQLKVTISKFFCTCLIPHSFLHLKYDRYDAKHNIQYPTYSVLHNLTSVHTLYIYVQDIGKYMACRDVPCEHCALQARMVQRTHIAMHNSLVSLCILVEYDSPPQTLMFCAGAHGDQGLHPDAHLQQRFRPSLWARGAERLAHRAAAAPRICNAASLCGRQHRGPAPLSLLLRWSFMQVIEATYMP